MFAVLMSPRKPGFLSPKATPAASLNKPQEGARGAVIRESRFTAGRKRAEAAIVFSPLVSYAYRAPVKVLGAPSGDWPGYFGGGWKGGDEPLSGWKVAIPDGM